MAADDFEQVPSTFVLRLRGQIAEQRSVDWRTLPSVGTWLGSKCIPSCRRLEIRTSAVHFSLEGDEIVPITPIGSRPQGRKMDILFKGTTASPFRETVDSGLTVFELKRDVCQIRCNLPPEQQRLLHKGKLLQDSLLLEDALPLETKAAFTTLFLVKGAAAVAPDAKDGPASLASAPVACYSSASGENSTSMLAGRAWHHDEMDEEDCERIMRLQLLDGRPLLIACIECGVNPGRLQTDGLCQICFGELIARENAALRRRREQALRREEEEIRREREARVEEEERESRRQKDPTHCFVCCKRIGLTGFECRCGYFYCATHRYAEDHDCSFDHRTHGREILARANPKIEETKARC